MKPVSDPAAPSRRAATLIALAVGVMIYCLLPLGPAGEHSRTPLWRWLVAALAVALSQLPGVPQRLAAALDRLRHPSPRVRAWVALAISIAAAVYFYATAAAQDRDFFPKTQDECSYAIQVRQLAQGRLWMPQHPLADFFDSFYLLVRPVYASMYFPGTAILNVPGAWLGWPTWVIPLLVAGACVGLTYRVVTEALDDGVAGALSAAPLVSLTWFRTHSILLMSQLPLLLLGLIMMWAYLRWRLAQWRRPWLLLIGAVAGWAAITRPLDALCYALPVGCAIAMAVWRRRRQALIAAALLVAGAAPFLAVQLIADRGITGTFVRTPFDLYAAENYPGTSYGFHRPDPSAAAQSAVPQKRELYEIWARGFIVRHQPGRIVTDWWTWRLPLIADTTLPGRPLLCLLPVGLLALGDRRRWLLVAPLVLFVGLYVGYTFFLEHYSLVVTPAVGVLLALGGAKLAQAWPKHGARLTTAFLAFFLAWAATGLWELNHWKGDIAHAVSDEPLPSPLLRGLHELKGSREIILFTYRPGAVTPAHIHEEPVYNVDVAWPDDAPLIRAHDLGERNVELFRYYAEHDPQRVVHRFDRGTGAVEDLGNVADLARRSPAAAR
jgi:hypothetical protein